MKGDPGFPGPPGLPGYGLKGKKRITLGNN
jgi:hypothetical protein